MKSSVRNLKMVDADMASAMLVHLLDHLAKEVHEHRLCYQPDGWLYEKYGVPRAVTA